MCSRLKTSFLDPDPHSSNACFLVNLLLGSIFSVFSLVWPQNKCSAISTWNRKFDTGLVDVFTIRSSCVIYWIIIFSSSRAITMLIVSAILRWCKVFFHHYLSNCVSIVVLDVFLQIWIIISPPVRKSKQKKQSIFLQPCRWWRKRKKHNLKMSGVRSQNVSVIQQTIFAPVWVRHILFKIASFLTIQKGIEKGILRDFENPLS